MESTIRLVIKTLYEMRDDIDKHPNRRFFHKVDRLKAREAIQQAINICAAVEVLVGDQAKEDDKSESTDNRCE